MAYHSSSLEQGSAVLETWLTAYLELIMLGGAAGWPVGAHPRRQASRFSWLHLSSLCCIGKRLQERLHLGLIS